MEFGFFLLAAAQPLPIADETKTKPVEAEAASPSEPTLAQQIDKDASVPEVLPSPDPAATSAAIVLRKDTPVHLMVLNEVTTKTHDVGHKFKLRVDQPIEIDGEIIVPVGATAWGEVLSAESSGNLGKSGKMAARLLYLEVNDQRVLISGETASKGKSGTAETVMGILGLGVFGLFAKGNNAKIKAGQLMTAFVSEDSEIVDEN